MEYKYTLQLQDQLLTASNKSDSNSNTSKRSDASRPGRDGHPIVPISVWPQKDVLNLNSISSKAPFADLPPSAGGGLKNTSVWMNA